MMNKGEILSKEYSFNVFPGRQTKDGGTEVDGTLLGEMYNGEGR